MSPTSNASSRKARRRLRFTPPTAREWRCWPTAISPWPQCGKTTWNQRACTDGAAAELGGVALGAVGEEGVKRVGVVGAAQLLADRTVAQQARDPGERAQMLGAGFGGRQQREHQIDRLIVDC